MYSTMVWWWFGWRWFWLPQCRNKGYCGLVLVGMLDRVVGTAKVFVVVREGKDGLLQVHMVWFVADSFRAVAMSSRVVQLVYNGTCDVFISSHVSSSGLGITGVFSIVRDVFFTKNVYLCNKRIWVVGHSTGTMDVFLVVKNNVPSKETRGASGVCQEISSSFIFCESVAVIRIH